VAPAQLPDRLCAAPGFPLQIFELGPLPKEGAEFVVTSYRAWLRV
jgi:hypothetical protein